MTAPSNANTSGLIEKLVERARVSTDPLLAMYAVEASKALVTAASAQARIAELEAQVKEVSNEVLGETCKLLDMHDRATAAEARADRLAKALETFAKCADELDGCADVPRAPDGEWAKFRLLTDDYRAARAALQREG